jgi:hypothetical protein
MYIEDAWKVWTTEARKVLGNRASIPTGRISLVFKFRKDMDQAIAAFAKSKVDLGKKLLDLQNSVSNTQNTLKDARIEVTRDDYDLDPKNPDDKKNRCGRENTRKVLCGRCRGAVRTYETVGPARRPLGTIWTNTTPRKYSGGLFFDPRCFPPVR